MILSVALTAHAAPPDLLPINPDIYTAVQNDVNDYSLALISGEEFTVEWMIENDGGASSGAEVRHYFSGDNTIDTGDQLVATDYIPVAAGQPTSITLMTKNLTAPLTAGTYYVGACSEAPTPSGFNCQPAGDITITVTPPDVLLLSPNIYAAGQNDVNNYTLYLATWEPFTIEWIVENYGGASSASPIRYYYSLDSTIDTGDQLAATVNISVGARQPFWLGSTAKTLLAPGSLGTYYVGACSETPTPSGFNCQPAGTIHVTKLKKTFWPMFLPAIKKNR